MKSYHFTAEGTISLILAVEADSSEEAQKLMLDAPVRDLCHQCSESVEGEWGTSGELDCEPQNIKLCGD